MSKTPKATGSNALSDFKVLEDRVKQVVRVVGETRKEKAALAERLRQARAEIETLESEVRDLRKNHKIVRTRVDDMIREISKVQQANLKGKEKRVV